MRVDLGDVTDAPPGYDNCNGIRIDRIFRLWVEPRAAPILKAPASYVDQHCLDVVAVVALTSHHKVIRKEKYVLL